MYIERFLNILNNYCPLGNLDMEALEKDLKPLEEELLELQHHKSSSLGLWCTDRPELIDKTLKEHYFFQLT